MLGIASHLVSTTGSANEMRHGRLRMAYLVMTLLLCMETVGGGDDKDKEGEDSKKPPPAENNDPPPSQAEETKPPSKEEETTPKESQDKEEASKSKETQKANSDQKTKIPKSDSEKDKSGKQRKGKNDNEDEKKKTKSGQEKVQPKTGSKIPEKGNPPNTQDTKPSENEDDEPITVEEKKTTKKKRSDKDKKKPVKSEGAVVGLNTPENGEVEENWLLTMLKMVDKKGLVTKLMTQVPFKALPDDLTGKNEEEIMGYVNILSAERDNIQERFLFGMAVKMFVGFVSYEYYNHHLLLPPLKYLADNDINLSASIEKQWGNHQERLASFLVNVMEVRKIDVKSLPKSQLGIPLLKMKRAKDAVVSFPVWRTEEDAELPAEAKQIASNSRAMLLNFWVN